MKTSIIIPCYNEKETVLKVIEKVKQLKIEKEIIVVDDCSTDGSAKIIKEKISPIVDKVIFHEKNLGKGGALHSGFKVATGDILIPQDSDLELNPNDIEKVVQPIIDGSANAVIGSRFLNNKMKGYLTHRLANIVLTKFSNFCTKQKITDVNSCYIAFKRDLFDKLNLTEKGFAFNQEIVGKLSRLGIKIVEIPIQYNPRTTKQGKKIRYSDGFRALKAIWKYRLNNSNVIKKSEK